MTSTILIVCVASCVLCPSVTIACVLLFSFHLNKRIRIMETECLKLLAASDARVANTSEMICKLSSSIEKMNETLLIVTQEYTRQLQKAQECRDKVIVESIELARANTILIKSVTTPKTIVNNNAR